MCNGCCCGGYNEVGMLFLFVDVGGVAGVVVVVVGVRRLPQLQTRVALSGNN